MLIKRIENGNNFCCKNCNYTAQADINAAKNHEIKLPDSMFLLNRLYRKKKFYWKVEGFYSMDGTEFTVPSRNKTT